MSDGSFSASVFVSPLDSGNVFLCWLLPEELSHHECEGKSRSFARKNSPASALKLEMIARESG
jgi:hypothetical protein